MVPKPEPIGSGALPTAAPGWLDPSIKGLASAGIFLIGGLVAVLAPVPLLIVFRRHGTGPGIRACVVGAIAVPVLAAVVGVLTGWSVGPTGLGRAALLPAYVLGGLGPALLLHWALTRTRDAKRALERGTMGYALLVTTLLVVLGAGAEGGTTGLIQRSLDGSLDAMAESYRTQAQQDEVAAEKIAAIERQGPTLKRWGKQLFPSLAVSAVVLGFWLVLVYTRWFVGGESEEDDLTTWRMPMSVMYAFMACSAAVVLQTGWIGELLPRAGPVLGTATNGLILLVVLYWLQGVAVLNYWFLRLRISPVLRMIGIGAQVIVMVAGPTTVLFGVLGLADAWFDLRKLDGPADAEMGELR